MTYNSQYGNLFVVHIPHRPTFKITKAFLFYHNMTHLIKYKNNAHIMVNDSRSSIQKLEEKNKPHTTHNVKSSDLERWFQHITGQPVKWILNTVGNNILQNLPILWEDVRMFEDIYGPNVWHFQGETVCLKVQHVELIIVPNLPKGILDRYKNSPYAVTSCTSMVLAS